VNPRASYNESTRVRAILVSWEKEKDAVMRSGDMHMGVCGGV